MTTFEDELFDELLTSFIKDYLKYNPLAGTYLGLHEYDSLLPDLSKEGMNQVIIKLEEYLKKFKSIDKDRLTGTRKIDYEPVVASIEESLILLRDWPTWRMYPIGFETVGGALLPLLIRDYLPLEHRLNALYNRVRKLGKMIMDSINNVEEPYSLWIDYTLMIAKGIPSLLNVIKNMGKKHGFNELETACDKILDFINKSLSKVMDLKNKSKPGFKPIGRELFEKLLKLRFIDEDIETLRRIGYQEAERYRKLMLETVKEMNAKSIEEGFEIIKSHHPKTKDEVFKIYNEMIKKVRKFIVEKDIVELPQFESIGIVETPEYLRPVIPFAAYMAPEVFSWSLKGIFLVTPPLSEEMLHHHNIYDIVNTIVHEAYPGHHIQLVYSKLNSHITRKVLIRAAEFIEGWAHYCEELLMTMGINPTPEYKFKVYHDALWRAVRVYVDVELSTGMITFEQAVEKLVKDAYLPKDGAYAEALRYTMAPGYQICYNYGKRKIIELREKVKKILGPKYSHKLFHKLLLEEGALPLKILDRIVIEKAKKIALS